jgi:hypothetical protein
MNDIAQTHRNSAPTSTMVKKWRRNRLFSLWETLPCDWEVRGHCKCKEMPVISVNKVVDPKRIIENNGGPRRRRGTRGCWPPAPPQKK